MRHVTIKVKVTDCNCPVNTIWMAPAFSCRLVFTCASARRCPADARTCQRKRRLLLLCATKARVTGARPIVNLNQAASAELESGGLRRT
jgi:hypothetical protein